MKTIFVTIKEFIENGGSLHKGESVYREERRHFSDKEYSDMLDSCLKLGTVIGYDHEQKCYLLKNESFKSFPITDTLGYVKIKSTPIYKL